MIIAKGDCDAGEILILGLSKQNIKKMLRGQPVLRDLRFANVPFTVLIMYGEDEMEMHRQLRVAGLVGPHTEMKEAPKPKDGEDP